MGNQIALAVANIKASVIVKILAADSNRNSKISLMIPTNIFLSALTLTVLLFVQNAEQIITEGKAQIGVAVIKLPVIKGRVFRKPIENWMPSGFCSAVFPCTASRSQRPLSGRWQGFPLTFSQTLSVHSSDLK